ncbi:bzip transcription factor [Grosmannia clavigera kw1407]|uniref:Bzip transcription factor n=1 Tax=Grosmannia clavigera (strain kw1407 / UAMH 11150) TaxID=655863 RepID=F0X9T5_GROCL|nr:bzip transcription factor [Grosmannia clavigera kw1407]EFX05848.1 bzip transcription factor [Grosmannia clavigera kw1407]
MQPDLAILNAEQFNIGGRIPKAGRIRRSTQQEICRDAPDSLQAALSAQQVAGIDSTIAAFSKVPSAMKETLKRASTASGEDGEQEKKRARGRPRVAVKDVTAADRRRTQIRLAQRAYRSRRENAIMLLKKKVQALKEANEAMSNAFMNLNDAAISYGLVDQHPGFARQLHSTTEVFLDLARRASGDEDDDNDEDEDAGDMTATVRQPTTTTSMSKEQQVIADAVQVFGYSTRERSSSAEQVMPISHHMNTADDTRKRPTQLYGGVVVESPELTESTMYSGQQTVYDNSVGLATTVPSSSSSSSNSLMSMTPNYYTNNESFHFGGHAMPMFPFSGRNTPVPNTSNGLGAIPVNLYGGLTLPKSFASLEGTFGLRLLRTALEKAYVLLSSPNPPPHEFARLFGLCVMFEPIEKIRKRVFHGLDQPLNATLSTERWGPIEEKDDCWPFTSDRARKIEAEEHDPELWSCTDIPGFENSFYDCHGTELYLRQRGVHIPAGSERIIVEVDADDFGGVDNYKDKSVVAKAISHSPGSSPRDAPFDWNSGNDSTVPVGGNDSNAYAREDALQSMLMFTQRQAPSQHTGATSIDFVQLSHPPGLSPSCSSRSSRSDSATRRAVALDVDRFVEELSVRATCIIRSPGFRPSDVNDAFWKAAQTVQAAS